jgi:DNA-binding NarL/FixJ family response regulator
VRRRREDDPIEAKIKTLTKREREIIAGICEGLRNKERGERLFISEATVRNHVTSILDKLELANRFDLVVFAFRHRLVERT